MVVGFFCILKTNFLCHLSRHCVNEDDKEDEGEDGEEYLELHEEVKALPFVPRGVVYRPNGRPVIQTLVVLECINQPPDGPLEDADEEDEEDCKSAFEFIPSVC